LSAVLDVAAEFLEPITAVRSREEVHASVVFGIFDADKDQP
jgi:hypothetical protein